MATKGRESAVARRLRELEEEERRLHQTMKDVGRHMRKLERASGDAIDSAPSAWSTREQLRAPELSEGPVSRREESATAGDAEVSRSAASSQSDKRFANYFSSGSFIKTRPLARQRRTERNKAIFMLLFVLLVGYLVYQLFF